VKHRSVGDKDELHGGQGLGTTDIGRKLDHFIEIGKRCWFTIAAEGNVIESAERRGGIRKPGLLEKLSGTDEADGRSQFFVETVQLNESFVAGVMAIDLAIDTVEIANLVGIQIDADRYTLRATADNRVNKPKLTKLATVTKKHRRWLGQNSLLSQANVKGVFVQCHERKTQDGPFPLPV